MKQKAFTNRERIISLILIIQVLLGILFYEQAPEIIGLLSVQVFIVAFIRPVIRIENAPPEKVEIDPDPDKERVRKEAELRLMILRKSIREKSS